MLGIEQPVIFMWSERRGHNQDAPLTFLHKFISNAGEFRGRGGAAPVGGKFFSYDAFARQIVRYFSGYQNQVVGRFFGVKMHEVFEHGQGLMFGSVGETCAWARPAATVEISAFAIERSARVGLTQHAINSGQLMPP